MLAICSLSRERPKRAGSQTLAESLGGNKKMQVSPMNEAIPRNLCCDSFGLPAFIHSLIQFIVGVVFLITALNAQDPQYQSSKPDSMFRYNENPWLGISLSIIGCLQPRSLGSPAFLLLRDRDHDIHRSSNISQRPPVLWTHNVITCVRSPHIKKPHRVQPPLPQHGLLPNHLQKYITTPY